jgi:hypothetical protein
MDALVGLTVTQARLVVEGAGGEFATDEDSITRKLDSSRLVARVINGRVVDSTIG